MGLPIFITPVEPEVASRATEKVAAGQRSSIRRQRTIRGEPQARSAEIRRRRIQDTLENEAREIQEINGADMSSIAALNAHANRFHESERTALGEPLSWERRHTIESLRDFDSPILPPAPDPELEARISREREIERLHQVRRDLRRMGRRRPAPTPPYTETDMAFMRRPRDSPRPSSLTPARSPARPSPPGADAETSSIRNDQESDFAAMVAARASRYREIREGQIQRERARAIAEARPPRSSFREFLQRTRMDGLGDRERSPEGGEAWDTLLTSIPPDPQPPSAGSSFASSSAAAAAASSSTSNSGPTWGSPLVTSPERPNESPDHDGPLRDCDEPASSDSNTEDDDGDLGEEFVAFVNSARARGDHPWASSYAAVARANRGDQSPDTSLEGMHRIIARLAERDDIPESWWASVGLRREPSA